ncbi:MAG: hypothetical protein OXC62_16275 [Aestuariivita sp.]|nr:hypothetical protein [Aestuariivita sp.]
MKRIRAQRTVLLTENGSDFTLAPHHGCKGLGGLSGENNTSRTPGLCLHGMFVVNDEGIPLDLPRIEFDCPDGQKGVNKLPEEHSR